MTVFITGDRSLSPVYPALVAVEMLRAVAQGDKIETGDNGGVELIVREFAKLAGIEVSVLEGDKSTFDARHAALAVAGTPLVVVHADAHASSMIPSILSAYGDAGDDLVRIATPADLVV